MAETALAVSTLFPIIWKLVGISFGIWIILLLWITIIVTITRKIN